MKTIESKNRKRIRLPTLQFNSIDLDELAPHVQAVTKPKPLQIPNTISKNSGKYFDLNSSDNDIEDVMRSASNMESQKKVMETSLSHLAPIYSPPSILTKDHSNQRLNHGFKRQPHLLTSLEFVSSVNYMALSDLRKSHKDNIMLNQTHDVHN